MQTNSVTLKCLCTLSALQKVLQKHKQHFYSYYPTLKTSDNIFFKKIVDNFYKKFFIKTCVRTTQR